MIPLQDALQLAADSKKDLVEVAPQANPPVCRIMDYGKFRYEQTKKEKLAKKKQHSIKLKEIKMRPGIFEHDYNIKIDHMKEFLGKGYKVKLTIMFRGREMINRQETSDKLITKVADAMTGFGLLESKPKLMGRSIIFMFGPIKTAE